MVRFIGVDLPRNKRIAYALTYIHGIGLSSANKIIELANISSDTRTDNLTTEQTIALRDALETINLKLESFESFNYQKNKAIGKFGKLNIAIDIIDGKLPYKEIFIQYGILSTLIHAFILIIFDKNIFDN